MRSGLLPLLILTVLLATDGRDVRAAGDEAATGEKAPKPVHVRKRRPVTAHPVAVPSPAPDRQTSQRAVCQSQCNLERMSCEQGRAGAFRDRSDQLHAASSCNLAVSTCLSRC